VKQVQRNKFNWLLAEMVWQNNEFVKLPLF